MDFDFTELPIREPEPYIRELFHEVSSRGGYILGGFARWAATPTFEGFDGDVDIFASNDAAYLELYDHFYKKSAYELEYENNTCAGFRHASFPDEKLQLVKPRQHKYCRTTGSMQDILSHFDFTVIRAGLLTENTVLADVDFLEDEKAKRLVIKNVVCPIGNMRRVCKYMRKGYTISLGEMLKLYQAWDARSEGEKAELAQFLHDSGELSPEQLSQLYSLINVD